LLALAGVQLPAATYGVQLQRAKSATSDLVVFFVRAKGECSGLCKLVHRGIDAFAAHNPCDTRATQARWGRHSYGARCAIGCEHARDHSADCRLA